MKKLLFTLLLIIFMIPSVKADENTTEYANSVYKANESTILDMYNRLMEAYSSYQVDNPYYHIHYFYSNLDSNYHVYDDSQSYINACLYYFSSNYLSSNTGRIYISYRHNSNYLYEEVVGSPYYGAFNSAFLDYEDFRNFASNMNLVNSSGNTPVYFIDTIENRYITVNLDNYEYVILNLKDYSKKDAFETNLQVKGSIGITPVYEFGTTEKENITDLCNLSYSDFTDYRFFVLKNDLINNAVYIVKECSDSGSSFRFDSSVFDITYVTTENVDDPVITFGGVDYHTIPFNKLSNTVNKNEEEGFIPGESGSSLTDIVDNITSYITSFWNSLSTFMGLVTKFFNTLPIEIRAIAITTFATACTLGLLKILKS